MRGFGRSIDNAYKRVETPCRFRSNPEHICHRRDGFALMPGGICWSEVRAQAEDDQRELAFMGLCMFGCGRPGDGRAYRTSMGIEGRLCSRHTEDVDHAEGRVEGP